MGVDPEVVAKSCAKRLQLARHLYFLEHLDNITLLEMIEVL